MKILVTNHWLKKLGGSETFTYTLVAELKKRGYEIDVLTFQQGIVSERIRKDFGIKILSTAKSSYDLILANHNTCVKEACGNGPIIQTCHGTTPKLEQPSFFSDQYVAISEEVQSHIFKAIPNTCVTVIRNGIDCNRFTPKQKLSKKVKRVLSLAHDDNFNIELNYHFRKRGIELFYLNKYNNPIWNVESAINESDLVISLGRGAYEAMACGRPVLVMDKRPYQDALSDGLVNSLNIDELIKTNLSGRALRITNIELAIELALANYNQSLGDWCRSYALDNLNIQIQLEKYFDLCKNRLM